MAKIIKKILTGLLIVAALLIFVPAFTALLMRTPKFQTFVVHRFTDHFSKKLGTHISVDHVSYTFFNKLLLYNVLIKDQNSDTLISAREISLRIKDFKPSEQLYRFGKIEVYEPDFRIITDTSGVMNLNWYIEKLKGDNEPDTTKKINLDFPEILVIDGACSLVNLTDTARSPVEVIDFSDLRLTSLNATLKNMQIRPDSVTFRINDLTFREKSGFRTSGVDMDALVAGESLYFSDVRIITDSSLINAERINIMPQDSGAYSDFINRVRMNIVLKRSLLNTSDLACFVFPLQGIRENVYLSGKITGTVSDLRGRNIEIEYSPATKLDFNFDVSGLPEVDNVYIFLDFNNLQTYASDIEQISIPGKGMLSLPLIIDDLGKISFRGNFTGFLSDFVAFGTLQTDRGNITTDISLRPEGKNTFGFEGMMKVADIDLGYLAKNEKQLGGLWLHANVIGTMKSFRHLTANINGAIDTVEINGYSYRNVSVAGTYSEKVWDGSVIVDDRNIKMDLLGRFDLSDTLPEFDFTLNLAKAKLHRLNLYEKDTAFNVSALMTATFRGNNIDNLDGDLRLINSAMHNSN